MNNSFLEKAEQEYNAAIKRVEKVSKVSDILTFIADALIFIGFVLALLWAGALLTTILTSGWKAGELHRVNILYFIAVIFHATGLIYYALPLAAILAGGGYMLLKYDKQKHQSAYDDALAKKERYLNALEHQEKITSKESLEETEEPNNADSINLYCYNCGKKLSKKHKFCPDCGTKVE